MAQNEPDPASWKGKPASTLLLVMTVLFSPILWFVDPGAMSNFWVSRRPRDE